MSTATPLSYSLPQKLLHWAMALLILFNLIFSDNIEAWDHAADNGTMTPDILACANIHAYVGISILALAVLRLILRLVQGAPAAPAEEPPLLQLASKLAHGTFYLLFFVMPLTGIGKYYFDVDIAGFLHGGPLKVLLWALIVVHVAAVAVHKVVWKTNVLERMTKG